MSAAPNIVLICVDQWRGDCLSIDGHPVVHTPWLDQLAIEGARFSRAYSACPSCIAARAALLTGLSQRTHGRVGYKDSVPWRYPVNLAGEFTRQGYDTIAVGKMHVFPERNNLGFKKVILHDGYLHIVRRRYPGNRADVDDYQPWLRRQLGRPAADDFEHGVNCNSFVARPWDKPEHVHPTNYVVTQAVEWLEHRKSKKPFFMFLSFHRPHPPFDPPAWAFEQYVHRQMPAPPVGDWIDDCISLLPAGARHPCRPDLAAGDMNPHVLQRARAGYYGHMTHIDHQINRFLEILTGYSSEENTYVCFTSDHGEMLGDHHLFRKSLPYEGSARVPLILKGPRASGIQPASVSDAVVELRDIMPTLLDCAGLPIPKTVEGRSLLPATRGEPAMLREYLHGEHIYAGGAIHWLTDGQEKYVWFSHNGREQLFNLRRDPQECQNLAGRQPAGVRSWRQRLIRELTGREEGFSDGRRLIAGRPVRATLRHIN